MNDEIHFPIGEYCAIYLDLMGQKNFLSELGKCDNNEAQSRVDKLSAPLRCFKRGAMQRAEEALDAMRDFVKSNSSIQAKSLLLKGIDDVSIGVQQFSDSTLLYVKITSPASFVVVLMMIEFVLFRMLDDAGRGFLLRGGITIGKGWEVDGNCLCGQVVADAHALESTVSNWGRVTVSELFQVRLKGVCGLAKLFGGCGFVKLIEPLLELIRYDIDGVLFLDYLNPSAEELYKREHFESDWFIERCENGYAFINQQLALFQSKAKADPVAARLALRYGIMRGYWKSRLEMWASIGKTR